MNAQLSSALDGFEKQLNTLLSSLTAPTAAGAPSAAISLLEADDVVTSALDTLRTHQANYSKILRLRAEEENLKEHIKGIVRDISGAGQDIVEATGGNDDGDYTDDESESDSESDNENIKEKSRKGSRKEVDYRLLLDFARRISKYNKEAAADAAAGIGTGQKKKLQDKQTDANGVDTTADRDGQEVPVENVTKEATNWLDQTADADRQMFMIPYPNEDRIRMGLMGQIQMAAIDQNLDLDQEAERMVLEAEGAGIATAIPGAEAGGQDNNLASEAAKAAANAGSQVAERGPASAARAPAPQPKAMLDLDLYDPDEDD